MSVAAHSFATVFLFLAGAAVAVISAFFIKRFSNQAHREKSKRWLRRRPRRPSKKLPKKQTKSDFISTDQTCSICFEDVGITEKYFLKCGHVFHKECIEKWTSRSHTCPNCMIGV